jgi:lysophospholipase L1-like esterase
MAIHFSRIASSLWQEHAMRRTAANIETLVRRIHRRNFSARIFLLGLYDPYAPNAFLDRAVNVWDALLIARFAADARVTVIRIADVIRGPNRISRLDHFHPSAAGYALIAARIAPAL